MRFRALTVASLLLVGGAASAATTVSVSGGERCVRLLAGQTIEAGTVCAKVSGTDLLVTYTTGSGWTMTEAHLWVGLDLATAPRTQTGNPQPGRFPYKATLDGATSHTFRVPLASLADNLCD